MQKVAKNKKSMVKKKKSQAALDYLMSWGWILIIIVLVLVILFSLGVFKLPSAPTIISGFQGVTMQAAEANSTMMVVSITNNYNQFINITGITVNVNGSIYTSFYCLNNILLTGQSTLCRVPVSIPTSSYLSKIQISFTPYKSSIYEVSNGTVSSTLVSGAIPINNQLTYFIERGLPYGSIFTVNYNTSTNSTTVSSVKDNVSFNLPFGNYYFSVPTVTYQGCVSTPSPSAGYHSTGVEEVIAFKSNCTTTFSETGLPSSQQWQVTFNGTTKSNSTGSAIKIKTNNTSNPQVYYTAIAKSDNLACVSYNTPSVRLGSSYTFSAWNCTTTFTESGLPDPISTAALSASPYLTSAQSYNEWYISNFGGAKSGVQTTPNEIILQQNDLSVVSAYPATANSYELSCSSYPSKSIYQGSSELFNWWVCNTKIQNTGVTNYPTSWNATFAGINDNDVNVNDYATFTQNVTTVTSQEYSTFINDYACSSTSSAYEGSDILPPWNCVTTFSNTGVTNYPTSWNAEFDGISENSQPVSGNINVPTGTGPGVLGSFAYTTSINSYSCSSSSSTLAGSTVSNAPWNCVTTFSNTGVTNYPTSWNAEFDGISENSQPVSGNINVPTGTGPGVLGSFAYTTSINSYSCSSSSSTLAGSTVSNAPWNCHTTFDTNSVLSGDYTDGWSVSFDSSSASGSTSRNLVVTSSTGPSILGSFSYSSSTGTYDCYSNNPPKELAGTTVSSIPWQCTTTFIGTGLPSSGYSGYNWQVTYFIGYSSGDISNNVNTNIYTPLGKGTAQLSISKGLTCSGSDNNIVAGDNSVVTTFTCNNLYLLGPDNITVISPDNGNYELTDTIAAGYGTCPSFGYAVTGVSSTNGAIVSLLGRCKDSSGHYSVYADLNPYSNSINYTYAYDNSTYTNGGFLPGLATMSNNEIAAPALYEYYYTSNAGLTSNTVYSYHILTFSNTKADAFLSNVVVCNLTTSDTLDVITRSSTCGGDTATDILTTTVNYFGPYAAGYSSYDANLFETEDGVLSQEYGKNVALEGAYGIAISNAGWIYSTYQFRTTCTSVTCQNNGFNVVEPSLSSHVYTSLPDATTSNNYVPVIVVDNQLNSFFVIDGNNGCVYEYGPLNTLSYGEEQSYCLGDNTLDGAALSPNENYLYVASYGNNETYVFDANYISYGYITTFKGPYALPPINLGFVSDIIGKVHFEDQKGIENGGFPVNNIISNVFQINSQSGLTS
ncbi:hypothetical protein M1558_01235 [Candidatus Parvarchaeota archaeon]|nr:hypothetical protein [Candidatus Parvarchaeota archaeon]